MEKFIQFGPLIPLFILCWWLFLWSILHQALLVMIKCNKNPKYGFLVAFCTYPCMLWYGISGARILLRYCNLVIRKQCNICTHCCWAAYSLAAVSQHDVGNVKVYVSFSSFVLSSYCLCFCINVVLSTILYNWYLNLTYNRW